MVLVEALLLPVSTSFPPLMLAVLPTGPGRADGCGVTLMVATGTLQAPAAMLAVDVQLTVTLPPAIGKPLAGVQVQPAAADVHSDQDFVVLEPGRLHRQAHAVLEADEGGVEIDGVLGLNDLARRAEALIGPGDLHGGGRFGHRDFA